jgi:YARHG domain
MLVVGTQENDGCQPASPSPSVITNVDRMSTGAKSFVVAIGLAFTLAYSVENKPITRSYQSPPNSPTPSPQISVPSSTPLPNDGRVYPTPFLYTFPSATPPVYTTPSPNPNVPVMPASPVFRVVNIPAGDYLYVRDGPGVNHQAAARLSHGVDGISITGMRIQNGTTVWVPITVGQVRGWVTRDYLLQSGLRAELSNAGQPKINQASSFDGERYPQTRLRLLTLNDLKSMSLAEVRYSINEVYARYGSSFSNDPDVQREFQKFSWYHPNPKISFSDIDQSMSEVEKQNIKLLGQYRARLRSKWLNNVPSDQVTPVIPGKSNR